MKNQILAFLKKDCVVIFDTNAYLNIYEYSPHVSEDFINVVEKVFERLIVPSTVKREFYKNHRNCHGRQKKKFENIPKQLGKYTTQIKDKISKQFEILNKYQFPNIDLVKEQVEKKLIEINDIYDEYIKEHNVFDDINMKFLKDDKVKVLIERLINANRLMDDLELNEIYTICEEGDMRYKKEIPPGYKDKKDKSGIQMFNDLIVWKEVIKFCKTKKKDVIFVTDDVKSDWWIESQRNRNFHPDLIKEFHENTDKSILGITSLEFFKCLIEIYNIQITSTFESVLNYDNDNYIDRIIENGLLDDVADKLMFSVDKFVDVDSLSNYDGSDFELEVESDSLEFNNYKFDRIKENKAYYILNFRVKGKGYSRQYQGKDYETKEIYLSDKTIHELEGNIEIAVERDIDNYFEDLINDYSYSNIEIIGGELVEEMHYHEDDLCIECGIGIGAVFHRSGGMVCWDCAVVNEEGDICPHCGEKVPYELMAGNGFCIECTRNSDYL